jgi:membrane protein implicated in regulation of membrane protease activity
VIAPANAMLRERTGPIIVIFCIGLMAEFIIPWAVIWLSDMFFFDIPGWSLWLLFGGSPALSLLAMLIHWALRTRSKQPLRAWGRELQRR